MTSSTPGATIYRIASGYYQSRCLLAAVQLGLADLLRDGPQGPAELAAATGTHAPSLFRLLRLLASIDILEQRDDCTFGLTAAGECLRSDRPDSMDPAVRLYSGPLAYRAWGDLLYAVRTGEPAFDHVYGQPLFDYYADEPAEGAVFNEAMTALTDQVCKALVNVYDFTPFKTVVDVGGGHGVLLTKVLGASPQARGVLFELPEVAAGAQRYIANSGFAHRCEVVSGDFFEAPPPGDLYIMKNIMQDWDDGPSAKILAKCREAIPPDGRLLIIEQVMPERIAPSPSDQAVTGTELMMLVMLGGRSRTESELRTPLAGERFELTKIIPLGWMSNGIPRETQIVEAVPV
jgi:hypothetical protein